MDKICIRAMMFAMTILTPKQMAALFRNVPVDILDNPELIASIQDFSNSREQKV